MSIGAYAADYLLNATQVSYNKNGTTVTVKEALDDLYSKVPYNQGDLVKLKGDTSGDTFYVLYESKDTMEIFAKTNINRDTCATQANDVLGNTACAFSSEQYWGDTAGLNLNNVTGYKAGDVMDKVNIYARAKGAISGRLLTIQEVENLAGGTDWSNSTTVDTKIKDMLNGVGNTKNTGSSYTSNGCYENYWLGSDDERDASGVCQVSGYYSNAYSKFYRGLFGVRPVLNVYKSQVESAS